MEKFIEDCKKNNTYDVRDQGKPNEVKRREILQKIQGATKKYDCYGKQQICKLHSTEQFLIKTNSASIFSKNIDDKYIWFPKICNVCEAESKINKNLIYS